MNILSNIEKVQNYLDFFFALSFFKIRYIVKLKLFNMIKKIKENFEIVALSLLLIIFLKQCSTGRDVSKIDKNLKSVTSEVSEIKDKTYTQEELSTQLRISGLEAEKRMIQATDRKLLDVNRQSEIEKEIDLLKKKK